MNKNVIFFYPEYSYPRKNPPIGLAYLAAYIRKEGFEPVIIDLNIDKYTDEKISEIIQNYSPLAVGISFMTNQYSETLKLAKAIKNADEDTFTIVGGPHVSSLPKEILLECREIDFSIMGEGEETFLELIKVLDAGTGLFGDIKGLCFRGNGEIVQNPPRELIADIDALSFPAWDLLKVKEYSVFSANNGYTFAILSSRGCPNSCTFCDSHTIFGRKFRSRSAENIFSEIEFLNREYGMTQFDFVDDMITLDKTRILELCSLLKISEVSYTWMANARVNTLDKEMLKAMKEAGCMRIDVGVESGDPKVREKAKKRTTNEQIINAHKWAKEIGVQVGAFTMVGNLGETMSSVKMTAELLKDIGEDVMISIACPYPGTELYRIAKEKGFLKVTDWSKYVTSPTYLKGYEPIMSTDVMDRKEILNAYYYLHSFFIKKKFQARYGKYFLVNPAFLKEWLFKAVGQGGLSRKISMFANLVKARIRS